MRAKQTARAKLVSILERSDRPESELRKKLKEKEYSEEEIDDAISWGKEKHYVDDARYVETYLRYHSQLKSKKKILYDLAQKGLDHDLVISMLEENPVDEDEQIKAELIKRGYHKDMDPKEKQKIYGALARKGYSWSSITNILGRVD